MTHEYGRNRDHIDMEYDPRYDEVNPQVWALQPYYSIFYNRNSVKKWPFSDLKSDFWVFCRVLGVWLRLGGWSLYTIFGPYVPHTLAYIMRKFQPGALKSSFATILKPPFLVFFGLFWPIMQFLASRDLYLMKAMGDQDHFWNLSTPR